MIDHMRHWLRGERVVPARRRIGFVPPGQEPELVPIDEGGGLDAVGGSVVPQDGDYADVEDE